MAAIFSPTVFATSDLEWRGSQNSASLYSQTNLSHYNRLSTRSSLSRFRATLLQDNVEKMIVRDSFPPKFSPLDSISNGESVSGSSSTSTALENWVIKFEQSVNIFLTEIGGNALWFDRFLSQHIAVFYYVMAVFIADHFSECVESHAFETYDKFIKAQGEDLKKLPAPEVAVNYYTGGDLYLSGLVWLSTGGKTGVSHFPCHFPPMNFKLPEFEILEGLR